MDIEEIEQEPSLKVMQVPDGQVILQTKNISTNFKKPPVPGIKTVVTDWSSREFEVTYGVKSRLKGPLAREEANEGEMEEEKMDDENSVSTRSTPRMVNIIIDAFFEESCQAYAAFPAHHVNLELIKGTFQEGHQIKINSLLVKGAYLYISSGYGNSNRVSVLNWKNKGSQATTIMQNLQVIDMKVYQDCILVADELSSKIIGYLKGNEIFRTSNTFGDPKQSKSSIRYDSLSKVIAVHKNSFAFVKIDGSSISIVVCTLRGVKDLLERTIAVPMAYISCELAFVQENIYACGFTHPVTKLQIAHDGPLRVAKESYAFDPEEFSYRSICANLNFVIVGGISLKKRNTFAFTLLDRNLQKIDHLEVSDLRLVFYPHTIRLSVFHKQLYLVSYGLRNFVLTIKVGTDKANRPVFEDRRFHVPSETGGYILGALTWPTMTAEVAVFGYNTLTVLNFKKLLS